MKLNFILAALLASVLAFSACKNAQKTTPATEPVAAIPATEPQPAESGPDPRYWRASHVFDEVQPDSAYPYQSKQTPRRVEVPWDKLQRPSTSRRAFMATGYWSAIMAYQPSDTTVHHNFLGKYLKFCEDQTFDIIVKNKVVDTGHWNFDEEKMTVYLSCQDPYFDNTWTVQERGFRMVWKGNTELNVTGIQVRMDNSAALPAGN